MLLALAAQAPTFSLSQCVAAYATVRACAAQGLTHYPAQESYDALMSRCCHTVTDGPDKCLGYDPLDSLMTYEPFELSFTMFSGASFVFARIVDAATQTWTLGTDVVSLGSSLTDIQNALGTVAQSTVVVTFGMASGAFYVRSTVDPDGPLPLALIQTDGTGMPVSGGTAYRLSWREGRVIDEVSVRARFLFSGDFVGTDAPPVTVLPYCQGERFQRRVVPYDNPTSSR